MNLRTKSAVFGAALAVACSLGVVPASAAVTFDPGSGTGFVGKGDVQDAFGWNNAQFQAQASAARFSYVSQTVYELICTTPGGSSIEIQTNRLVAHLDSELRGRKQVDGYQLTGIADSEQTVGFGLGSECFGAGGQGTFTAYGASSTTASLVVTVGAQTVALPL